MEKFEIPYRELADLIDIERNTSSNGGKQGHELSSSDEEQGQQNKPSETVTDNLELTPDLEMLGERGAEISDLRGEAASEFVETKDLEVTDDLVEDTSSDEERCTVEPR